MNITNQILWMQEIATCYVNTRYYTMTKHILITAHSWSTVFLSSPSRIRPSWPRSKLKLCPILASTYEHASCCHAQPSILLFIAKGQVSHVAPSAIWVAFNSCTSKHHNNVTRHTVCAHMYIHHISITTFLFFVHIFHSSWQAGWPQPIASATILNEQVQLQWGERV